MCVPMHGKLESRKSAGKQTIIHPAARLWGESGDVQQFFKERGSPCSRVSLFRAFKARNLFFCFYLLVFEFIELTPLD